PLVNQYDEPALPVCWMYVVAGVLAVLAPAVLFLRRRPRAAFAAALFLVPLVPVLNVFYRTGEVFAERFLCLPLAGLSALVGISPARATPAVMSLGRVHLRAAHGMAPGDPARQARLVEAERLFRAAIGADPTLPQVRGALGLVLLDLGRRDEAERMMREELA